MSNKPLFLLTCGILSVALLSAETTVPGGYVSGTWSAAGSPYLIMGDITIHADSTMIIEPSVKLEFQGIYSLTVNGYLEAVGTQTDSIHFNHGNAVTNWGGIYFTNAPDSSHLAFCRISHGGGQFFGFGGIICTNSNPVITHCHISDNRSRGETGYETYAGGIGLNNSNAVISWCNISNNKSGLFGGGINIYNSSPVITGCNISGNETLQQGGGIYITGNSSPMITNCTIEGNKSNMYGGGISATGAEITISECTIGYNQSYDGGGGISISGGSVLLDHCVIEANQCLAFSGQGGGLFASGGSITVDHCTFFADYVIDWSYKGMEIHTGGNAAMTATNSIFYGECNLIVFGSTTPASVSFNNFQTTECPVYFSGNTPAGMGQFTDTNANGDSCDAQNNIFLDPLFVNMGNRDYRLQEISPCIDAGDPVSFLDPDNTVADIGANYFHQPGNNIPGGYVSGTWMAANSPYSILGDITIPADSVLTIEPGVDVIFEGLYTFQVNGKLTAVGTETQPISFTAADTVTGWKGIRLDAGADSTWLSYASIRYGRNTDGGGIYCASPKAVITHCTIANNAASYRGGGICINNGLLNPAPFVEHCVIRRNSAQLGGGVYYMADSMVISDCEISDNSVSNYTGVAYGGGIHFAGGFASSLNMVNCTIQNNFCESDSGTSLSGLGGGIYIHGKYNGGIIISDCRILKNWSRRAGGGIFVDGGGGGATIQNSLIRGNSTKNCAAIIGTYELTGGAGICFFTGANATIFRCEISENTNAESAYGGAGIKFKNSVSLTVDGSTIAKNYAPFGTGSGIKAENEYSPQPVLILTNSIIAFNRYGVYANNPSVTFCNFFDNEGKDVNSYTLEGNLTQTNANGDSCDINSNIYSDPFFADVTNSDYQLTWSNWPIWDSTRSHAINAGDPAGPNDPDSTISDIGSYFFDQRIPVISLSDTALDFGDVYVGNQADLPLNIHNDGSDTLELYNLHSGSTVFTSDWDPSENLILPGDSLEITVYFQPDDAILFTDTLQIQYNHQLSTILLTGQGKIPPLPVIALSDTTVDFGTLLLGHSAESIITLYNTGTDTLAIYSLSNKNTAFNTDYDPADSLLMSGDSLSVTITFTPDASLTYVDTLFIGNNFRPVNVRLTGKGELPSFPIISLSDTVLDFGTVPVSQFADLDLTIYNSGTGNLVINGITSHKESFSTDFIPADSLVSPGDSLRVKITFTPGNEGAIHDTLFIINNDQDRTVKLAGNGQSATGIHVTQGLLSGKYALLPAYPNPFNSITTFVFDLPVLTFVTLSVYNILGEQVCKLISENRDSGRHRITWNPEDLPGGVYFYRLQAGECVIIRQISYIR